VECSEHSQRAPLFFTQGFSFTYNSSSTAQTGGSMFIDLVKGVVRGVSQANKLK